MGHTKICVSHYYLYYVNHGKTDKDTCSEQNTVKPVCNDHLYNEIHYLWFIH